MLCQVRTYEEVERWELAGVVDDVPKHGKHPKGWIESDAIPGINQRQHLPPTDLLLKVLLVNVLQEQSDASNAEHKERPVHHSLEILKAWGAIYQILA
jgi:hypothetical protein